MTANPLPNHLEKRKRNLLAIALVVIFAIAAVVLTRPTSSFQSLSPLSGLMTLKATAQGAIPYDVAVANHKPSLIEFYADWCTTCQAMAPILQAIHHEFGDQVNFVMLDIDDPHWRNQVEQFQVRGVPHLALLKSDRTLADTFIGKVPKPLLFDRVALLLE